MKIKCIYNDISKNLCFGNVNIFYGYNNSNKTKFANYLADGFSQKSKTIFQIDGYQPLKNDYEVIYIDSFSTIDEQIKFSTKSLLKKMYFNSIINKINENNEFSDYITKKFLKTNDELGNLLSLINQNSIEKISIQLDYEDIEDLILNSIKVNISSEYASSSNSRELLMNIIIDYLNYTTNHKIIIIDDFDCYYDEASTKNFFDLIKDIENATFVLFTNKATSLQFALSRYNVFNIRENRIIDFTNIYKMIEQSNMLDSNDNEISNNFTFEEYMITNNTLFTQEELIKIADFIISNSNINFGRILTNKNFSLSSNNKSDIKICPINNYEKLFLQYINKLIIE
ncbi:MAG: hypothetical protein PHE54_05585 [Bacilli bacterium]|nr:hypothetical protein [Bacilli bacterium]